VGRTERLLELSCSHNCHQYIPNIRLSSNYWTEIRSTVFNFILSNWA